MNKIVVFVLISFSLMAMKADKAAYQLFTKEGKATSYSKMMKKLAKADVVFFGELHNNAISHWMELEVTKDLYELKKDKLVLGAEMFEADGQLLMDEYLKGVIPKKNFEAQARLWPNHKTDYAPLVDFAAKNKLQFIATNVPRRYASIVAKKGLEGLDSLSNHAKMFIAPLPIAYDPEVACYKDMAAMMGGHGGPMAGNIPKAQALKDATMAHFIHKNFEKGQCFLHYNGAYHSQNHEGIIWYLKKLNPKLKIMTIHTSVAADISKVPEDEKEIADFIMVVDEDVTTTY